MESNKSGLHLLYRPKTFDEVVGNEAVVNSLKTILSRPKDKIPHVFMFTGNFGCGKSTLSRIVAKSLDCSDCDLSEIDVGTDRGVDDADYLKDRIRYAPMKGSCRVFILDELQMSSPKFQGALLKTLEDNCPKHVYFILCTTDPQKINKGILSRCQKFALEPLNDDQIISLLRTVINAEKARVPNDILKSISTASKGSARESLVILDQVISLNSKEEMQKLINTIEIDESQVIELCRSLMKGESWNKVSGILKNMNTEPEKVRYAVLSYCSSVLLNSPKGSPIASIIMEAFKETFFYTGKAGLVLACDKIVNS